MLWSLRDVNDLKHCYVQTKRLYSRSCIKPLKHQTTKKHGLREGCEREGRSAMDLVGNPPTLRFRSGHESTYAQNSERLTKLMCVLQRKTAAHEWLAQPWKSHFHEIQGKTTLAKFLILGSTLATIGIGKTKAFDYICWAMGIKPSNEWEHHAHSACWCTSNLSETTEWRANVWATRLRVWSSPGQNAQHTKRGHKTAQKTWFIIVGLSKRKRRKNAGIRGRNVGKKKLPKK